MNEEWLVPWRPILESADDRFAEELHSELCSSHALFGIAVRSIACRQDCDDVLFKLLDGSGRFAVVHLTFAQHPEPNPTWPETRIFESWEQFNREEMQPGHDE